jgi:CelD/BcsL family acetyltransferase involved in cellulose biosynthesis
LSRPFSVTSGPGVDRRAWWGACEADPGATFFATPEWCDVLVRAFPAFRPRPTLFTFGSTERVVVPAIEVRRAFGRLHAIHSMPFGTYGGLVGADPGDPNVTGAILDHLVAGGWSRFQTTVYPNPLSPRADLDGHATHNDRVLAPDLDQGFDAWWQGLDARTRYHVRKAENRGVTVRSEMDVEDYDAFYHLYQLSSAGWDAGRFGRRFFEAIWDLNSPRIELWSAHAGGRLVAGVLAFRWNRQVTPFLSALDTDARILAPTNLLYTRMIERYAASGDTRFSFLGSGGKRSVERFKRSMGGHAQPFGFVKVEGPAHPFVRNRLIAGVRRGAIGTARRVIHRRPPTLLDDPA